MINKIHTKNGHTIKWFDPRLQTPESGQKVLIIDRFKSVRLAYYRENRYGEIEGFIENNHPEPWQKRPLIEDVLYWSFYKFELPKVLDSYSFCAKEVSLEVK